MVLSSPRNPCLILGIVLTASSAPAARPELAEPSSQEIRVAADGALGSGPGALAAGTTWSVYAVDTAEVRRSA